ncbi:MAG: hypothetical protein HY680_05150 [Chloroflexi bacterium]|nr:hypothetical protein [Chloroflexota bacterium]
MLVQKGCSRAVARTYRAKTLATKAPSLDKELSIHMESVFKFRYFPVKGRADRIELEERIIATIAQCEACFASANWLGKHSLNARVSVTGLWNDKHTGSVLLLRNKDFQLIQRFIAQSNQGK